MVDWRIRCIDQQKTPRGKFAKTLFLGPGFDLRTSFIIALNNGSETDPGL